MLSGDSVTPWLRKERKASPKTHEHGGLVGAIGSTQSRELLCPFAHAGTKSWFGYDCPDRIEVGLIYRFFAHVPIVISAYTTRQSSLMNTETSTQIDTGPDMPALKNRQTEHSKAGKRQNH